jgi:ABC-type branched-subunit amino acid transport system ATPase component
MVEVSAQVSLTGDFDHTDSVLLSALNLSINFGGLRALSNVSISVPDRKIVGLIGPNGAGKTTLFETLTGYLRPTSGRVLLSGRDITYLPPYLRARLGLGRSFQHSELFSSLTVAEHLLLGYRMSQERDRGLRDLFRLTVWKGPTLSEREMIDHLLTMLGLQDVADHACSVLPTGITRLVEVGRVLAMRPKLIMLDEPAAGLDDHETEALDRALRQIMSDEEVSILVVEHDLEFVFGLSSHISVLDAGVVIASGTPDEIRNDQTVQQAYLGVAYSDEGK